MRALLVGLMFATACASAQLTAAQRMELIEKLDQSGGFAQQCGLGRSEMRVRFAAMPDGSIAEPVVIMGATGTSKKMACVLDRLKAAKLSPHTAGLIVRTERLLPTARTRTDDKLLADSAGLSRTQIDRVMKAAEPTLRACDPKQRPTLDGLTVFFLIDPDGKVTDVLVESALGEATHEWCLLDAVRALHFDKPGDRGFVEASWPRRQQ